MTFFIKRDPKSGGKSHIFEERICFCDGLKHDKWVLIREGIKTSLVTCGLCLKKLKQLVMFEMGKLLKDLK